MFTPKLPPNEKKSNGATLPDYFAPFVIPAKAFQNLAIDQNSLDLLAKGGKGQRYAVVAWAGIIDGQFKIELRFKVGLAHTATEKEYKAACEQFGEKNVVQAKENQIGYVHTRTIELIDEAEPELRSGKYFRLGFSVQKIIEGDTVTYDWVNRSSLNKVVFLINALPLAYFAFNEDFNLSHDDQFNHLMRSIPQEYFEIIMEAATKIIASAHGEETYYSINCRSFRVEEEWNKLRDTPEEFWREEIERNLNKNLFIFLARLSSPEFKDDAEIVLKQGFESYNSLTGAKLAYVTSKEKIPGDFSYLFENPLINSIKKREPKEVEYLLSLHFNPNLIIKHEEDPEAILHLAARTRETQIVKHLLHYRADPNFADRFGETALHKAAITDQFEMVKALIENKADPNIQTFLGETPLFRSILNKRYAIADYLLSHHADVAIETGLNITPLLMAVTQGDIKMIELLLKHKADPYQTVGNGNSPINEAETRGQTAIVEMMQAYRKESNPQTKLGT
ncbi:MAG: ankyrin repeat domain-containing protein [Gammaproteobacteria bacterium]